MTAAEWTVVGLVALAGGPLVGAAVLVAADAFAAWRGRRMGP